MSDELALGQRTGIMIATQGGFTQLELELLATSGVNTSEIQEMFAKFPDQTLNDAIGGVVMLRNGQGQERNEPFQTQAEADVQVSSSEQAKEEAAQVEEGLTPPAETST